MRISKLLLTFLTLSLSDVSLARKAKDKSLLYEKYP